MNLYERLSISYSCKLRSVLVTSSLQKHLIRALEYRCFGNVELGSISELH